MKPQPKKSKIDQVIADVCIRIVQEPLLYFSEADVQQMLVEGLNSIKSLKKTVPTAVPRGKDSRGCYHTCLVHREYGSGEGRRVDVVIFDPDDAAKINSSNLMCDGKYLKPLFAFELGTEKTADAAAHMKNDLAKLQGTAATGYVIHFFKDTTLTPTGETVRQRTEDKIDRSFRAAFESMCASIPANVRVLAILLRTGRNQKRILGKCEILDQQHGKWNKVNVGKKAAIRDAILKQLE